jgi:hypothetical protein
MSSEADDIQVVEDFAATASEFCELVDRYADYTVPEFIRALDRALTELLYRGSLLTWPDCRSNRAESAVTLEAEMERSAALNDFLGDRTGYSFVFDPADPDDHEAITFSVGTDLAEIYRDLKTRRMRGPGGRIRAAVVWDWRFGFESHWGLHALDALKVVHALIAWHGFAEDD